MYSSRRLANLTKERAQFSWITSKRKHQIRKNLCMTCVDVATTPDINNLYLSKKPSIIYIVTSVKKKSVSKSCFFWCYEASFPEFIDNTTSRVLPVMTLFSSPCCGFPWGFALSLWLLYATTPAMAAELQDFK